MSKKVGPVDKQLEQRKVSVHEANSVTKDFMLLSQPFIHQGILIASALSGRRLYIHHLSEVPQNEVFLTRTGNHLQRTDRHTLTLAGSITLKVEDIPAQPSPSVQITQSILTSAFSGPIGARDETVLKLLQRGKDANSSDDFKTACGYFEAAYALSVRAGMLVSAANMRLKLDQPATAAAMYRYVLTECSLLPAEQQMASRKLAEARAMLKDRGLDGAGSSRAAPQRAANGRRDDPDEAFTSFASFGDGDSDGGDGGAREDAREDAREVAADERHDSIARHDSFDADFGDFGDTDGGFEATFGEPDGGAAPERPFASAPPSAAAGAGNNKGSAPLDDFASFDELPQPAASDGGGFAAFDAAPPPPPVQLTVRCADASGAATRGVGSRGGAGGDGNGRADGGAVGPSQSGIEERLRVLEAAVSAKPIALVEMEQRLERLSAQVERRFNGVKTGMKGLHERLQAVEVAMAKLPDHLTKFRDRQKAQARLSSDHAAMLSQLEAALPALSAAATECAGRMGELAALRDSLASGEDALPATLPAALGSGGGLGPAAGWAQPQRGASPAGLDVDGFEASPRGKHAECEGVEAALSHRAVPTLRGGGDMLGGDLLGDELCGAAAGGPEPACAEPAWSGAGPWGRAGPLWGGAGMASLLAGASGSGAPMLSANDFAAFPSDASEAGDVAPRVQVPLGQTDPDRMGDFAGGSESPGATNGAAEHDAAEAFTSRMSSAVTDAAGSVPATLDPDTNADKSDFAAFEEAPATTAAGAPASPASLALGPASPAAPFGGDGFGDFEGQSGAADAVGARASLSFEDEFADFQTDVCASATSFEESTRRVSDDEFNSLFGVAE